LVRGAIAFHGIADAIRMRPSFSFSRAQLLYVPLLAVTALLQFGKNFLYARFLPVAQFGTLGQYLLASSLVASWCGLGFNLLAHKVLPMYYAGGREREASRFLGAAFYLFMLVLSVAVACGALVAWLMPSYRVATVGGVVAVLLSASSQYTFQLCLIDVKSRLDFVGYAKTSVVRALAVILFGVVAAKVTRNAAAVLCCDGVATLCLAASLKVGAGIRSGLVESSFGDLVRDLRATGAVAIRLLWLSTTVSVLYALDRWAGVALLTKEQFGLYALALSILAGFETAQMVANVSIYPIMANLLGRGHTRAAFRLAVTATAAMAVLGAILYGPGAWLFRTAIGSFLPAYAAAGVLVPIAMVVGCLRMADFLTSFVILSDRETASAACLTALGIVCAAGLWWAVRIEHVMVTPQGLAWFAVAVASMALCSGLILSIGIVRGKTPPMPPESPA
jgi:O-antigen/teichoic acid export membrane protein